MKALICTGVAVALLLVLLTKIASGVATVLSLLPHALIGLGIFLAGFALGLVVARRYLPGGNRPRSGPARRSKRMTNYGVHAGLDCMEDRIETLEARLFDWAAPGRAGRAGSGIGRTV